VLARSPELSPVDSLRLCHAALGATRGAAVSIALVAAGARLEYAGVGNVEAHLWQGGVQQRLIAFRGIVGAVLPQPRAFSFDLRPDWLLVMHTDGIRARFELDAASLDHDAQRLADDLLAEWSRPTDDAAVVVVRASA
jgi:hypothetical protein